MIFNKLYRYIALSSFQAVLFVVCLVLLFKDMRKKGGLSWSFLKQHQTVMIILCALFSLGKISPKITQIMIRSGDSLPRPRRETSCGLLHRVGIFEVHLLLSDVPVLLQGRTAIPAKQGQVASFLENTTLGRHGRHYCRRLHPNPPRTT